MKGLFIIGNKRSGSTHMMRLLNLHPNIFISNESDIIWILYNFHKDNKIEPYPHDVPKGMNDSIAVAGHLLDKEISVRENFGNYQKFLMEKGFLKVKPNKKEHLTYIGDQKPYQNIDPDMMPFILENFPEAKFIHIVRHPFEVVTSSLNWKGSAINDDNVWQNMSPTEILAKWEMHENWVNQARKNYNIMIHDIRYSELISNTQHEMRRIFQFLEISYDEALLKNCRSITNYNFKPIISYELTKSQKELAKYYKMKVNFSLLERNIIPKLKKLYFDLKGRNKH